MKYLFSLITLLTVITSGQYANGQEIRTQTDTRFISDLLFTRFSSNDGLPDNRIRSIFQDKKGFMWIGTMNGISKYDGYTFKKYYNTKDTNSISGSWANVICEDNAENVWIGTRNGLNMFNVKEEKFISYQKIPNNQNSLFCNRISTLKIDKTGKLWIGTEQGLATFNPITHRFFTFRNYPFNINICNIIKSAGDFIWIATKEGVVHYNIVTNKYTFYKIKVKPDPYGDFIWSIFEDNKDLYIGTASDGLGMLKYNAQTNDYGIFEYLNVFSNGGNSLNNTAIFDICKSNSGAFLLATNRGLAKIEKLGTPSSTLIFYKHNPISNQSLSNNTVYKVFIDKTDILWCGTELGLNKLDLHLLPFQYFTFKGPQSEDQVRSIATLDGENIWLGTAKHGFFRYNIKSNITQTYSFNQEQSPYNSHRSVHVDKDNIWMGTLGGAIKLNPNNPSASHKEIDGSAVFAFLKDSKGNLWLGTNYGLYEIKKDGTKIQYSHKVNDPGSLSSEFVRSLYEDHNGNIWVGFETTGLSYLNPATGVFTHVNKNANGEEVFGNLIFSILEYPKNVLWAGSESGLNKITLKTESDHKYSFTIKNYNESDGLSDKSVNGILADNKGFLWISTIKGLFSFDIKKEQFRNYLPTLNFSFSCYYKFSDNKLLFGTTNGFLIFDPAKVSRNDFLPTVVISDLKLFNKEIGINSTFNGDVPLKESISETKEISLGYRNNVFTLGFVGLHFSNPEDNSYAYKMVGFDKDWIYTKASNRSATYTNLDPGTYYFKVKASNSFGKWNEKPVVLTIHIIPPPWKTWWAYTIYLILFSVIIYVVVGYILIHSKQKHELEMEHKMRVKEEELHEEQRSFFTNITHELQTPLTLINGSVERMFYKKEPQGKTVERPYYLSLIHQQSSRLTYLVNQMLDFRKAEAGYLKNQMDYLDISGLLSNIADLFIPLCEEKNLDYVIDIKDNILGWTDKDKLEKIIFNLLSNAFKHSVHDQKIIFSVSQNDADGLLEIIVTNSGCELTPEQLDQIFQKFFVVNASTNDKYSNGIGLAFTKQLVTLLEGNISVSTKNNWIVFKTNLPIVAAVDANPVQENKPQTHKPSYLLRSIAVPSDKATQPTARENNKRALIAELEQDDKKTILIVEDEPAIRYLLKDMLSESYIVYEAEDGHHALDLLKTTLPDLIISDIMMPDINGLELCNKVKNSSYTCHIPFILLSARGSVDHKTEGYDAGADAYIAKPFDTMHLLVRVRKLLEYRDRLHDLFKKDDFSGKIEEEELVDVDKKFLNTLVKIIEDNLEDTDLDATILEQKLIMSKMQLYRKLKALSNMAPAEFIKYIRLKKAAHLLQSTQLTVSEIFYRTGFNNQSYFFREFKKRYECSPNEFRAQNRTHA